jgi:hypothetical protein
MRRVLLTLLALIAVALLGAGWYAYHQGLTHTWRGYVAEEFRKRGIEVSLRRLTLDPLRGLVAKEVRLYDAQDRKRTIAFIDEMILQVNYANLARGKTFLDALDLRDATLSLPLDPAKPRGQHIDVSQLNARLFLPPQQIFVAHADAVILGVQVNASGRLINPQAFRMNAGDGGGGAKEIFARIASEIQALKFEAEPPVIRLTFSGDLADAENVSVDFALWAERIRRKNYLLKNLYLSAGYRGGVIDLRQFTANDTTGELRATGLCEPELMSHFMSSYQLRENRILRARRVSPRYEAGGFVTHIDRGKLRFVVRAGRR